MTGDPDFAGPEFAGPEFAGPEFAQPDFAQDGVTSEPLVLRYTPDRGRMAAAHLRWVVAPVRGIVCTMVALAAVFVMVVQLLVGTAVSPIALAVAGACVLVWLHWTVDAHRRGATGPTKVTLDDRGLARAWQDGSSALAWDRFERWLENDEEFLVLSRLEKSRGVTLLPKSDLDEATQERVRLLLGSHIDPGAEPLDDAFVEEMWDEDDSARGLGDDANGDEDWDARGIDRLWADRDLGLPHES